MAKKEEFKKWGCRVSVDVFDKFKGHFGVIGSPKIESVIQEMMEMYSNDKQYRQEISKRIADKVQ